MGTWGPGILQNDSACDFLVELLDGEGLDPLEAALDGAQGPIAAWDAQIALAAAEVVAWLKGRPSARVPLPDEGWVESVVGPDVAALDAWVERQRPALAAPMIEQARRAVARILSESSDLSGTWRNPDDFAAWKHEVEDLLERLQ